MTQAEAKLRKQAMALYSYERRTGIFRWKQQRIWKRPVGSEAGQFSGLLGHRKLYIDGKRYPAHWIAWLIVYGRLPKNELDHKNVNPSDNRIANLREATRSQNILNKPKRRDSTAPYKGIGRHQNKWRPRIRVDGKTIYFGLFDDPKDAFAAYKKMAKKHYGGFHNFSERT
jgi:hypothetical protein